MWGLGDGGIATYLYADGCDSVGESWRWEVSFEGPPPNFNILMFVDRILQFRRLNELPQITLLANRLSFQIPSPELPLPPTLF